MLVLEKYVVEQRNKEREREREREREMNTNLSSYFIFIAVFGLLGVCHGQLRMHFYEESCPHAEEIVKEIIWNRVASNSTLPAKFLRMHFHDCFVRVIHLSPFSLFS